MCHQSMKAGRPPGGVKPWIESRCLGVGVVVVGSSAGGWDMPPLGQVAVTASWDVSEGDAEAALLVLSCARCLCGQDWW